MATVQKSALVLYSAADMYALVNDVESYPQFLPWCNEGVVLEHTPDGMLARIGMSIGGFKKTFSTRNAHVPDRRIHLELVDGPFSRLDGTWDFKPVGDGSQKACKIEFSLNYAFASSTLAALVGPVFDKIASTFVDAFVKRADQVYGA